MDFKKNTKSLVLWVVLGLFLIAAFNIYRTNFKEEPIPSVVFSDLIEKIKTGKVKEIIIKDEDIRGTYSNGQTFAAFIPRLMQFQNFPMRLLEENNVRVQILPPDVSSFTFLTLFHILFPVLCIGLIWFFFFRQVQSNSGRAFGFGRSKAQLSDPLKNQVTFKDVEGVDEAKEDLQEVVDFLSHPEKFQKVGGRIPRGILLVGPPGTGKTLLAKAVAGEAGVPFFSIAGSDFMELFVGVGASRVRDMFRQAQEVCQTHHSKAAVIFIDEIDAVGRARGNAFSGANDEREQTLNQLLVEMDGFEGRQGIIVIAATNRVDVLDPALLRPGRFDRQVYINLPDLRGRTNILNVYLKKIKVAPGIEAMNIAKGTPGFSGADLENLVNEAALRAARLNKEAADQEDFYWCVDKLIMGPEKKSLIMTEKERRLTACHEAGHAVVAYHSLHSDPIHKATIMPRGMALGMVVRLPQTDQVSKSKVSLLDDLAIALAGRIAEELCFGPEFITTGASNDLKWATKIARNMVLKWGMSETVGLISYDKEDQPAYGLALEASERAVSVIDEEVKKILADAYLRSRSLLLTYRDQLSLLSEALLEYETLSGQEIKELFQTGSLQSRKSQELEPIPTEQKESTPEGGSFSGTGSGSTSGSEICSFALL